MDLRPDFAFVFRFASIDAQFLIDWGYAECEESEALPFEVHLRGFAATVDTVLSLNPGARVKECHAES